MVKISAVIITFNEEKNIERCIKSLLGVADEIVVVDSFSTDRTEEICNRYNVVFVKHPFGGYGSQKNYAVSIAKYDYILSLDADEALSVELEQSIIEVKNSWKQDAYRFNRLNYYCGQWIKHTSWYPDSKVRLFDRRKGGWTNANIHEVVCMQKSDKVQRIKGELLHWSYTTYEQHLNEINRHSTLSAHEYYRMGIKPNFIKLVIHPLWRFIHSFIIKLGFLDGYNGLYISIAISKLCMSKYIKLKAIYDAENRAKSTITGNSPCLVTHDVRIAFDAKRAYYNNSGLGNYSRNLTNAIVAHTKGYSIFMFTPSIKKRQRIEKEKQLFVVTPPWHVPPALQSIWRSRWSSHDAKRYNIDIYHGLSHELPMGIHRTGVKTVLTVHDLIFIRLPHLFKRIDAHIYKRKITYACKVADVIVAISTQTKNDIVELMGVAPERIVVIPQGCNPIFQQRASAEEFATIKQKYALPDSYMLSVGTIEPRKNLLQAISAMHEHGIDIPFVAIGRKTDYYYNEILPYIEANGITSVIFPENVTNEELPAIYQNATCFIYPSLYEGFGIPIIEALTSGIPVITSRGNCFEETGGDACIYIDPTNSGAIADAIKSVMGNSSYRNTLIEKGYAHVHKFSPENIANQYIGLYNNLLKQNQ